MSFPSYIPESVAQAGDSFAWKGTLYHIGKLEGAHPMMRLFSDINSCGCFAIASGLAMWNAARFSELVDVKSLVDMSDGALAFMCNPLLLDYESIESEKVVEKPKVLSAFRCVRRLVKMCLSPGRYADNAAPPVVDLYHLACLTRHLLSKKDQKVFDQWLKKATDRVRKVARRPRNQSRKLKSPAKKADIQHYVAYYWGLPVPRKILEEDIPQAKLQQVFAEEVKAVDWKKNAFVSRKPNPKLAYGYKA